MSKLEQIIAEVETLPDLDREELIAAFADMVAQRKAPPVRLTAEQLAELRMRAADPGPFATDEAVEALFTRTRP
jgi:hypothetical protein